jgi:hypothetical protein
MAAKGGSEHHFVKKLKEDKAAVLMHVANGLEVNVALGIRNTIFHSVATNFSL